MTHQKADYTKLSNQQEAMLDYLKRIGQTYAFVAPETRLEEQCASETLNRHQFGKFSGTLEQLRAYYELRNKRFAEMIADA